MPALPNLADAILDIRKLADYCLSPTHPRGRHKARLFREVLGLQQDDAEWLRGAILDLLQTGDAEWQESDEFGSRWRVDIPLNRAGMVAVLRTIWIIRADETAPRFVTCWIESW